MFCPKCGVENADDREVCASCNWALSDTTAQPIIEAKTSRLAIATLVLGMLIITALPAFICGIFALVRIAKSKGQLKGAGLVITGMVLPYLILAILGFLAAMLMPLIQMGKNLTCQSNLNGFSTVIMYYSDNFDDKIPTNDKWCDLFISECDVAPRSFICEGSDVRFGESSYALNENAVGMKFSELPADMVLLFEAKFESEGVKRNFTLKQRGFVAHLKDSYVELKKHQSDKVYELRWNQVGGAELLATDNHTSQGCNILFADGFVEFVLKKDFDKLKWTAEE